MKKWNSTLKSVAVIIMVALVWSCNSKDDELPIEDEDDGDPIGTVYLEENFEKMIWGGDYLNQERGIKGVFIRDADNKYIVDEDEPVTDCAIGTDGSPDLFDTASEAYKVLRGINEWDGWKVYERPGYLKIGTATARDSYISTPALEEINEDRVNLNVSVDLAIWEGSSETLYIEVLNGGVPSVSQLQISTTDSWTTREFTVSNATKNTKIAIQVDPTQVCRFFLGNIKITKAE